MKLTFLGTAASEGYPSPWCDCENCRYARTHGGRNIRANSCASIDGRLLIDFGPTCADSAARHGVDLARMEALLITHSHEDHLYPHILRLRGADPRVVSLPARDQRAYPGKRFTQIPELTVYGNRTVGNALADCIEGDEDCRLRFVTVEAGKVYRQGDYEIIPVPANHGAPGFCLNYIIRTGGRTLLYALDGGPFSEAARAILRGFCFDLMVMECTAGPKKLMDGHMWLDAVSAYRDWLIASGCAADDHRLFLSHMSPHWCPPHDRFREMVKPLGLEVAYDGLCVEV